MVTSFDAPPRFTHVTEPVPVGEHEVLVDVVAAGLHPRVRSQAGGSHYTSTGELPLVPGIDGVGRDPHGRLRYFILPDTTMGSMAERTVIDVRRSVVLADGSDPLAIAAAMNPVMSAWLALRRRTAFEPGSHVLVLGATGNAGRMAVQVARHLGADEVVAAGRSAARLDELAELGATEIVALGGDADAVAVRLGRAAARVDVVLDYLWGAPTAAAIAAVVTHRADRAAPLTWIEVGAIAGPEASIPAAALRAARLQIVGSGQGSVGSREILAELPAIAEEITAGTFVVGASEVPLADVERAWTEPGEPTTRLVLVPSRVASRPEP